MTASILLALAVTIGAFGAHGLKSHLSAEMMQIYKTGVEYHFYHALGLLLIGVLAISFPSEFLKWSAIFLTAGIVLFSGSLYVAGNYRNQMDWSNYTARRTQFYCWLGISFFGCFKKIPSI